MIIIITLDIDIKKLFKTNGVNIAYNNMKEALFNTNLFFIPL